MVAGLPQLGDDYENTSYLEYTFDDRVPVSMSDSVYPTCHGNRPIVDTVDFCTCNNRDGRSNTSSRDYLGCLLALDARVYHDRPIGSLKIRAG